MRGYRFGFWVLLISFNFILSSCLVLGSYNGTPVQVAALSQGQFQINISSMAPGQLTGQITTSTPDTSGLYAIRLLQNGAPVAGYQNIPTTNTSIPFTISGLNSGTPYSIQAQTYYVGDGHNMTWTQSASATTPSAWTTVSAGGFAGAAYSNLNVTSTVNHPYMAWTTYFPAGKDDHKYLFGGVSVDQNGTYGNTNILWKLNAATQWTPLTGTLAVSATFNNSEATYGTKGAPSFSNSPPSLNGAYHVPWSHNSCVSPNGDYWIYGGISTGWAEQDQLWKFNESNGWAVMSGHANSYNTNTYYPPVYGTPGLESSSVNPGSLSSTMLFCANDGTVYLFGGVNRTYNLQYNSFFRFNPATLKWSFIRGAQSAGNLGSFGSRGVTVNANVPSARQAAGHCVDGQGVLWMYGGTGIDASGTFGALSDMWKFDGTNWTWVAGSNTANVIANWGTQNVESATNTPGGRQTPLFCGPTSTNLRLSGGYAFSNSSFASLYPNWPNGPQDVWDFDITTGQWVWRAGNNNTASEITQNLGTTVCLPRV
jgi:hypothetical protein